MATHPPPPRSHRRRRLHRSFLRPHAAKATLFLPPSALPLPPPRTSLPPQSTPRPPTPTCRKSKPHSQSPNNRRSRAAKRTALYQSMRHYHAHFHNLLTAELQADQTAILQHQLRNPPPPLRPTRISRLFSHTVLTLQPPTPTPPRNIPPLPPLAKGDLVHLSPYQPHEQHTPHPPDPDTTIHATVLRTTHAAILVTVPSRSEAARMIEQYVHTRHWLLVYRAANQLGFDRASLALDVVTRQTPATPPLYRMLVMSFVESMAVLRGDGGGDGPRDFGGACVVRSLAGADVMGECLALAGEVISVGGVGGGVGGRVDAVLGRYARGLNASQVGAVRAALQRRLTLIQGPPGTGKTLVAACLIRCAVGLGMGRVLACAASNVAADNLVRRVRRGWEGGRVVRVGRVSVVDEELWGVTLESFVEGSVVVRRARRACGAGELTAAQLIEVEKREARRVLTRAQVVVATCVGCGRTELEGLGFSFVVVDEATQATETDVLIPLSVGSVEGKGCQVVLVGDHHQLPPTVLSRTEKGRGLEVSLFRRMWESGVPCEMLNVQYRMHPDISSFPAAHFYFNRLRNGVGGEERPLPAANGELDRFGMVTSRVVFVNVEDGEEQCDQDSVDEVLPSRSYFNVGECSVVLKLLQAVVNEFKFGHRDIGIISPYAGQVKLIGEKLQSREAHHRVEVCTVDGFQGREAEVIILSTVRNNSGREVGFLRDWRRLNVALSRARVLLIVVGSESTLASDYNWRSWFKWIKRSGMKVRSESLFHQGRNSEMNYDWHEETDSVADFSSLSTEKSQDLM